MDSTGQHRFQWRRLFGLSTLVLGGSFAGFLVGSIWLAPMARRQWNKAGSNTPQEWVEKDTELWIRCAVAGLVVGAICGYALFEIIARFWRRGVPKN
jgi:membrane-associated phospholipid phosphatase